MSVHIPTLKRHLGHRATTNPGGTTADGRPSGGDGNTGSNGSSGQSGNGNGNGNSQSQGSSNSGSQTSASDAGATSSTTSPPAPSTQSTTSPQSSSSSTVDQATSSSTSSSTAVSPTSNTAAPSTQPTSSSSSSTASTTSSSTLSTTSSSSTSVSVSTSTHISIVTPTNAVATQTSSFASVSRIFSSSTSVVGAEATTSAKPSGAINTGAIVGSIAGALAGLAVLGFLVGFFLRRVNRRKRAQRFEAAQFRRSAMVLDDNDDLPAPRPREMVQNRGNNFTDSVTSTTSPGLAGAGAYRFQEDHQGPNAEHGFYPDNTPQQYYEETQAVPMQRAPLQPRQQYTFGHVPNTQRSQGNLLGFDDYANDAHHVGEAHGDYTAYSPSQSYHAAGAHPSGRLNAKSSMDEDDAYGGI